MLELIILAPLACGVLAYALSRNFGTRAAEYSALLGSFLSLAFASVSINALISGGKALSALGGFLYMDSLSAIFTGLTSLVSFIVFIYSIGYIRREVEHGEVPESRVGLYYTLLSVFLSTMLASTLASNLIMVWAAIESTTLASAFLISFYNKRESIEAAWKFFLINSVGITIALVGILIFGVALSKGGEAINLDIPSLLATASAIDPTLMKIAFAIVLVGYGTKVGIVPMHTWLPDAHSQAPTPVSAILSGVLLNIALYGILRVYQIALDIEGVASFASSLFVFFGMISLGLASMRLFYQSNMKRMLAYSSVENMGIALLAFGIGGPLGVFAALFHLMAHSLAKPLAFLTGGAVALAYGTKEMDGIKGAASAMPFFGILLVIALLGIAGSVPFGTFFSEIALIGAALAAHDFLVATLAIIFIAIAFGTMLYKGGSMAYGEKPEGMHKFKPDITMTIAIAALFLLSVYLAFGAPAQAMSLIESSAKLLVKGA